MVSRETKLVVTLDDLCDEFIHTKVTLCGIQGMYAFFPIPLYSLGSIYEWLLYHPSGIAIKFTCNKAGPGM